MVASYSPLTHVVGCVELVVWLLDVEMLYNAFSMLRRYRSEHQGRLAERHLHPKLPISPGLLLRCLNLCACLLQVLAAICVCVANWMIVLPWTRQRGLDVFLPRSQSDLDAQSRWCVVASKQAVLAYALIKLLAYSSLFLKQRAVRVMQPALNRAETLVLLATCGIPAMAIAGPWFIQGDASSLDDSCVLYVQPWLVGIMCFADTALSLAYLALFLGPLRTTIQANKRMQQQRGGTAATAVAERTNGTAAAAATASHGSPVAPSATRLDPGSMQQAGRLKAAGGSAPSSVPHSPQLSPMMAPTPSNGWTAMSTLTVPVAATTAVSGTVVAVPAASPPSSSDAFSRSLEFVMRRNSVACAVTISMSAANMLLMTVGMIADQPHIRKISAGLSVLDVHVILATLRYVLQASNSTRLQPHTAAVAPAATAATAVTVTPGVSSVQPHSTG